MAKQQNKGKIAGQATGKDSAASLFFSDERNFAEVFNRVLFLEAPIEASELSADSIKEIAELRMKDLTHGHTLLVHYCDLGKR